MIFDKLTKTPITEEYLKSHGWNKSNWGSPDYYDKPKRNSFGHREEVAHWLPSSMVWDIYDETTGICMTYFPHIFNKYVNISLNPRPHDAVYISHVDEPIYNLDIRTQRIFPATDITELEAAYLIAKERFNV